MSECYYCGTKNKVHCCEPTIRQYKDRIIALFRAGSPTDEQLEEMAEACLMQSEYRPEKMVSIDRHIGMSQDDREQDKTDEM